MGITKILIWKSGSDKPIILSSKDQTFKNDKEVKSYIKKLLTPVRFLSEIKYIETDNDFFAIPLNKIDAISINIGKKFINDMDLNIETDDTTADEYLKNILPDKKEDIETDEVIEDPPIEEFKYNSIDNLEDEFDGVEVDLSEDDSPIINPEYVITKDPVMIKENKEIPESSTSTTTTPTLVDDFILEDEVEKVNKKSKKKKKKNKKKRKDLADEKRELTKEEKEIEESIKKLLRPDMASPDDYLK